jgi:subtilisin family serine protease
MYDETFTVGTTDYSDVIASFSSRGPVTADGSNRLKPDVCAPGVDVRSATSGGGYAVTSGASVAAPHVAGLVALLVTANPHLAGRVGDLEALIADAAVPRSAAQCGDGTTVPNNVYGHGRIDAAAACAGALTAVVAPPVAPTLACGPNPFNPQTTVRFTLPASGHAVLTIYDPRGHEVARLVDGPLDEGPHVVAWDGRDARGATLASGTYFCRLSTLWSVETATMTLVR